MLASPLLWKYSCMRVCIHDSPCRIIVDLHLYISLLSPTHHSIGYTCSQPNTMNPSPHPLSTVLPLLLLLSLSSYAVSSSHNYLARGCDGNTTDKPKLYIQGFVPASGDVFTSENIVPASSIACREVNKDTSVLSDYELVIEWSDTEVRHLYTRTQTCYCSRHMVCTTYTRRLDMLLVITK